MIGNLLASRNPLDQFGAGAISYAMREGRWDGIIVTQT